MNFRSTSLILAPIALLSVQGYGLQLDRNTGLIANSYVDAPSGTYNNVIWYFSCPV